MVNRGGALPVEREVLQANGRVADAMAAVLAEPSELLALSGSVGDLVERIKVPTDLEFVGLETGTHTDPKKLETADDGDARRVDGPIGMWRDAFVGAVLVERDRVRRKGGGEGANFKQPGGERGAWRLIRGACRQREAAAVAALGRASAPRAASVASAWASGEASPRAAAPLVAQARKAFSAASKRPRASRRVSISRDDVDFGAFGFGRSMVR